MFDQTAVQLMTEDNLVGNGAVDPDAQAFANWFTDNYDAIAQEEYTVYDYPNETVGGEIPSPVDLPEGCYLAGRCPHAVPHCKATAQDLVAMPDGRDVRCWRVVAGELEAAP